MADHAIAYTMLGVILAFSLVGTMRRGALMQAGTFVILRTKKDLQTALERGGEMSIQVSNDSGAFSGVSSTPDGMPVSEAYERAIGPLDRAVGRDYA